MWQPAADQFVKFVRGRMATELFEFFQDDLPLFSYSHAEPLDNNGNRYYIGAGLGSQAAVSRLCSEKGASAGTALDEAVLLFSCCAVVGGFVEAHSGFIRRWLNKSGEH